MDSNDAVGVTVTFNSSAVVERLLDSTHGVFTQHIVIDNASSDNTCELVARFDHVTLIQSATNLGFARAVNLALENFDSHASLMLLNPDVVLKADTLQRVANLASRLDNRFIVAPRLTYEEGEPQESVRKFPTIGYWAVNRLTPLALRRVIRRNDADSIILKRGAPCFVDWAIGAALYVPRQVLARIGPMDGGYFLYCEDVEWCHRAWSLGSGVVFDPTTTVCHTYARASKRTFDFRARAVRLHWSSVMRFCRRHPALVLTARSPGKYHGLPVSDSSVWEER